MTSELKDKITQAISDAQRCKANDGASIMVGLDIAELTTLQSALDTQKPAGDAAEALDWFNGILDVFHSKYEATEPDKEAEHISTIRAALNGDCGGGDLSGHIKHEQQIIENGKPTDKMAAETHWPEGKYVPSKEDCQQSLDRFSEYDSGKVSVHNWRCMNYMAKAYLQALTADNAKRGDNTAAYTKMGDTLEAFKDAYENNRLKMRNDLTGEMETLPFDPADVVIENYESMTREELIECCKAHDAHHEAHHKMDEANTALLNLIGHTVDAIIADIKEPVLASYPVKKILTTIAKKVREVSGNINASK